MNPPTFHGGAPGPTAATKPDPRRLGRHVLPTAHDPRTTMSSRPADMTSPLRLVLPAIVLALASCGSVPERRPLPPELAEVAQVPGIPEARMWGDVNYRLAERWTEMPPDALKKEFPAIFDTEHSYLAISGGGENGAFGAGLLCGWTERGDRPEFTVVTGISTGALSAPFAFLGPRYDAQLKEVYTSYRTKDIAEKRGALEVIGGDSMMDTAPLARLIEKYMTAEMLAEIAAEHETGRRLLVSTTHLDAARPVIWNIGKIATSGHPDALALFRKILLASASIPVAFPPVYFEVEANGERYDELHVDGGATAQVFLFPVGLDWREACVALQVRGTPTAYVIRNAKVAPVWKTTDPGIVSIAGRTMSSMIRTQGIGDLFRLYAMGLRDGVAIRLAYIPEEFEHAEDEMFDPTYMTALFERGHEMAVAGFPWETLPPDYDVQD